MVFAYVRENLLTAFPFVIARHIPVNNSPEPIVARIGGIWNFETSNPLKRPKDPPIRIARRNTKGMAKAGSPPAASVSRRSKNPIRMEVRFAVPTTDKSMPPVIMHSITPRLIIPNSGNCAAIVWKLIME
jgi:hypothetical protein